MSDLAGHAPLLRASLSRMVSAADADDLVQETLLRALVHRPDASAPIAGWLLEVSRNLAVDFLRKRGRIDLVDADTAASERDPAEAGLREVLPGLGALSDGEVIVLLLRDGLDLSVDETADALGSTPGSVRVLHHRARSKAARGDDLEQGLRALERFLSWLLARAVAGFPVRSRRSGGVDPGMTAGVLSAYAELLDAMVDVASESPILEARARMLRGMARRALGAGPDAERDLREAIRLGAPEGIGLARLSFVLHDAGRNDEAVAAAERALTLGVEPGLAAVLHAAVAGIATHLGDTERAGRHAAALTAAEATPAQRLAAHSAAGNIALAEERWDDARAHFTQQVAIVGEAGNVNNLASALNNVGYACVEAGDYAEARRWLDEAMAAARRSGSAHRVAYVLSNQAMLAQAEGRLADAATGWDRCVTAWHEVGASAWEALSRMNAAVVDQALGRPDRAARALREALPALEVAGMAQPVAECRVYLLAAEAALGESVDFGPARQAGGPRLALAIDVLSAAPADQASVIGALTPDDLRRRTVRNAVLLVRGTI